VRAGEQSVVTVAEPPRDKAAFQELARAHLPRLLAIARNMTHHDAEDLVQEALLRAYQSFDSLKSTEAAGSWLRTILVRCLCDRLRKDQRSVDELPVEPDDFSLYRKISEDDPLPYSDSVHLDFLHSFSREDVRAVLMRLPEIYRGPLVLFHMEGYATKEIAKLCRTPIGTVLARLHRGRKAFEHEMWSYAEEMDLLKRGSVS
jgi:RNA polymerase sigma-70 factor (ECF subfamily)